MSSLNVITKTGFTLSESSLIDDYPQLTEKMVVDLVNGLEVVNDQIKVSKKRATKFNRLIDCLNGSGKERQDLININLTEGLKATHKWLGKHERDIASVNLATIKIGKKLLETRQGVMKLKRKQDELIEVVDALTNKIQENNTVLQQRIKDLDYRTRAEKKSKSCL